MMTRQEIQLFFDTQLEAWQECASRYDSLAQARTKTVTVDGREHTLMFNPARMRSAAAKVADGKVDRPCFLCRDKRPPQQTDITLTPTGSNNTYLLSVNPFPILPTHLTIISDRHCRQTITAQRLEDMAYMARHLEGFLVFFNGACSGASAPDHFHFQAVPNELVPLTAWDSQTQLHLGVQNCEAGRVKVDCDKSDYCNILCWNTADGLRWWVVRRRQHRPWQYAAEGDAKVLISPAALEFAGVVPLAREEDFDKMDSPLLTDIFSQCRNSEPYVDVGLGIGLGSTDNGDGTHTVDGVRIGIGFHWDQRRTLRYEGQMLQRWETNTDLPGHHATRLKQSADSQRWLVNRLPVEDYLRSVISSEMSPTSGLQLLKAHAVISRSWLLRQMWRTAAAADGGQGAAEHRLEGDGYRMRWYDSDAHTLFDVCADDHCQRYQGIADRMNATVAQAIDETRGEVLVYHGEVCDTRFSKCCGGVSEEYGYCWDNREVPYLRAIRDCRQDGTVFCDTDNAEILRQVLNDYDQTTRDFFSWKVEYTQQQLSDLIERKLQLGLGTVGSLEPVERGPGGRISRLRIVGSAKTLVIGKELEIRRALSDTHLYSSNFSVEKYTNAEGTTVFRLTGLGWGHGVGLCQIGAAVMGAEGYDYKQILNHYYTDAEIKRIW